MLSAAAGQIVVTATRAFTSSRLEQLEVAIRQVVCQFHQTRPLDPGLPVQALREQPRWHAEAVQHVIDSLMRSGGLINRAGLVALAGWNPEPSAAHTARIEAIAARLDSAGIAPPSVTELSSEFGADVTPELRFLERGGRVVQVEADRYFTTPHLNAVLDRLRVAMAGGVERSPAELRETLDLSRKYLIPLLEYCDRMGHTIRSGTDECGEVAKFCYHTGMQRHGSLDRLVCAS